MLSSMAKDKMNILMVSETKQISSFPETLFGIEGNVPLFRYEKNSNGGGSLLFVTEGVPAKIISTTPLKDFKGVFVEINFHKEENYIVLSLDSS